MSPKLSATVLKLASWSVIAFALLLGTASYAAIDAPAQFVLDLLDWPLDGNHADISRDMRWMASVVSGLLVLLGTMMIWIVAPQVGAGNKPVARVAFWGVAAWAVIDCVGSYAAGVGSNSLWNMAFAMPFLASLGLMNPNKA
ncbi:hypothetical protein ACFQ14_10495 [Pseudahrensia aquimaris]|uniref:Uncharacterized protein n=1 Tax=Pseudahrensia aquimaris TaxID=744461 RepID=A0ABW3FGU2_9HYPH